MKTKKLFKNVSLALLGIGAIGVVGYGGRKLVQHITNDTKSLNLIYDIGALGTDGKYVNDESRIYTKEKFACEGLKAVLDFDSEINYQLFYYDILDNFVSSSNILTSGYSKESPIHGAYARVVITPTNDEDGKISFMEKYKYGNQLNVSVNKNAEKDIKNKYISMGNVLFDVTSKFSDVTFVKGKFNYESNVIETNFDGWRYTSDTIYDVSNFNKVKIDRTNLTDLGFVQVIEYDENFKFIGGVEVSDEKFDANSFYDLEKKCHYILINLWLHTNAVNDNSKLNSVFTFSK